eukprot:TRINITY_DN6267_c0_g1_i1.p1 TRINITY_DN6267_c0_g1~~TRINITY_DN6267_c0_g1_i1.p1  ORF type:complete len:753 (-),score=164.04 TRINITY_DN6267_c0_g1_i1:126-2384(-)
MTVWRIIQKCVYPTLDDHQMNHSKNINLGSLLRLFKSIHFDTWMAVSYLWQYSHIEGVQAYLSNEFYKSNDDDIEFYLSQLCSLVLNQPQEKQNFILRFLLDKASKSVHFALKISWMFSAMSEPTDENLTERCHFLRREAENATFNRRRSDFLNDPSTPRTDDPDAIMTYALSQKQRCDHFKTLQSFVEGLGEISNRLRSLPPEQRHDELIKELARVNEKIQKYPGLYLPLDSASSRFSCLANIPPSEAVMLSSRDRAPFLIIVEVLESDISSSDENVHMVASSFKKFFDQVSSKTPDDTTETQASPVDEINNSSETTTTTNNSNNTNSSDNENPEVKVETKSKPNTVSLGGYNTPKDMSSESDDDESDEDKEEEDEHEHESDHEQTENSTSNNTTTTTTTSNGGTNKVIRTPKPRLPKKKKVRSDLSASTGGDDWVILESPQPKRDADILQPQQAPRPKSILYLREKWSEKEARIRKESPYSSFPRWKLQSLIVKYGDDCRQERMALQLISEFDKIFRAGKLPLYIRPYKILVLSPVSCLIETVTNAMSIHQLKKDNNNMKISEYFAEKCKGRDTDEWKTVQANFVESLAAYSIVTYFLQIKDRHNGNILIDTEGHLVHIDFGFMLSNSPGSLNFENSPFKLTEEYIDFMDGVDSAKFQYFKVLVMMGFMEVRKHCDKIVGLVNMIFKSNAKLPCLVGGEKAIDYLKERFVLGLTEKQVADHIDELIAQSINNWRTVQYDQYQFLTNGILY